MGDSSAVVRVTGDSSGTEVTAVYTIVKELNTDVPTDSLGVDDVEKNDGTMSVVDE